MTKPVAHVGARLSAKLCRRDCAGGGLSKGPAVGSDIAQSNPNQPNFIGGIASSSRRLGPPLKFKDLVYAQ